MKKTVSVILLIAFCLILMSSCSLFESKTVTFVIGADYENEQITVSPFATVIPPETPEREGYVFDGWYQDHKCTERADFNRIITEDTVFYAGWIAEGGTEVGNDGVDLTPSTPEDIANLVAVKSLNSCVMIQSGLYPRSYCGGVVIGESKDYYYVIGGLKSTDYLGRYKTVDARGNEYETSVATYDSYTKLAVFRIPREGDELKPVALSNLTDATNTDVVVIRPEGTNINVSFIERVTGYTYDENGVREYGVYTGTDNEYSACAPIFDKNGDLVGVHLSAYVDGEGSVFITAEDVYAFIVDRGLGEILGGAE